MDFKTELPIYLQVMTHIKRDIITGVIHPGAKLPSVRDLALQYTINPNTASRVYRELEAENICFTRRGMGTFVTEDTERINRMKRETAQELIQQFMEGMAHLGFTCDETMNLIEKSLTKDKKEGE